MPLRRGSPSQKSQAALKSIDLLIVGRLLQESHSLGTSTNQCRRRKVTNPGDGGSVLGLAGLH